MLLNIDKSNPIGIVNKPQFDTEVFKVGKAVHIRQWANTNGYKLKDVDGIIVDVTPLEVCISIYNPSEKEMETIDISIQKVVSEEYELTLLKEDK